ncbi:MAG: 30S ribosomal protein S17e [Candidatus Nanoarchaeia archaeon]|jgi:ribosomal protein S17E
MGRIRTNEIKTITKLVVDKYGLDSFSDDFDKNKESLKSLAEEFPSHQVLNKVAGCIVNLVKDARIEAKALAAPSVVNEDE